MKSKLFSRLSWVLALGGLPMACNAITGIDRFSVDPDWSSAGGGGIGGSGGAGGMAGSGGMGGGVTPECMADADCPSEMNACQFQACVADTCQLTFVKKDMPATQQIQGDCHQVRCDGAGTESTVVDTLDLPDDGLECTLDLCAQDGTSSHAPKPQGELCNQGMGRFCDGTGQCVQCNFSVNCNGGTCVNHECYPAECGDSIKNGDESDIDCGGPVCPPCGTDQGCLAKSDCQSKVCIAGTCRAPTCMDMTANGDETDVDCGGPTCTKCADTKKCLVAGDCISGVCMDGVCQVPKCTDGVENGSETDLDCGAGCPGCAAGKSCNANLDCASEVCRNGKCVSILQVDAGTGHACALLGDGTVYCWGANGGGQLGDGTMTARTTVGMVPGLSNVTQISTGAHISNLTLNGHTCARTIDGKLYCWGRNTNGQVGDGTAMDVSSPKLILAADVAQVSAGRVHTCARLSSGGVNCWGNNGSGQLGNGTLNPTTAPAAMPIAGLNAKSISAGANHTCAVLTTGELSCWGANLQGQLGNGTMDTKSSPIVVPGTANMVSVDTGYGFTCAIDMGGVLRCFGNNSLGELGLGNMMMQLTPQVVTAITNASAVSCGTYVDPGAHSCVLRTNGGVACAGRNDSGQLGLGDTATRMTHTSVSLPPVAEIAAGFQFTCARLVDGPIRCWGRNDVAQLGAGKASSIVSTPQAVVFP